MFFQKDPPEIDLGVAENTLCGLLVPVVHRSVVSVERKALDEECTLILLQELGSLRPIRDEPVAGNRDDDGEDTLQDKDPGPPTVACNSLHVGNCIGEQAAECACNDGSGEEKIEAPLQLVAAVVHGEQVNAAWEKPSLQRTDDDSADHQPGE